MTEGPAPQRGGDLIVAGPRWFRWIWVLTAVAVLSTVVWWMRNPADLRTLDSTVTVSAKPGRPVYVGVLGPDSPGGERSVHLRSVGFAMKHGADVEVLICHGGSIGTTTDPELFCDSLGKADGETLELGSGDQLVVRVTADETGTIELGRLEVAFRDGLQWAAQEVGPKVVVDVVG